MRTGLLLVAHGERGASGANDSVMRIAEGLRRGALADAVALGFVNAAPTIAEAMQKVAVRHLIVYPLFMSDGHFVRVRLPRLLNDALELLPTRPEISVLRPLGLDPDLAPLIAERVRQTVGEEGWPERQVTVILLAHGSTQSGASRQACQALRDQIAEQAIFGAVRCAFLEEPPSLADSVASAEGPCVVVGMFIGEGLHGGEDVPRAVAELARRDVVFAGNLGNWPEVSKIVADACAGALASAQ